MNYLSLAAVGLVPVIASIVLYILNIKVFTNIKYWPKQIVFGLIFGGIAIMGTEFGVPIYGVTMNVRDAAPLCAGLFFGWPAAIIAGLVGGIERWFAVYWGAGTLTRLACCLGTIVSGLIGASVKAFIHKDDEIIKWPFAFGLGAVAEIIHMLLVILTNYNATDIESAITVVQKCTVPMTLAVSLSVGVATLLITHISYLLNKTKKRELPDISVSFQKTLFVVMLVYLVLTNAFCIVTQRDIAKAESNELLLLHLDDAVNEVKDTTNDHLISVAQTVGKNIEDLQQAGVGISNTQLEAMAEEYSLSVINLVNDNGIIYASSQINNLGYDTASASESNEFVEAFKDENTDSYVLNVEGNDDSEFNGSYVAYRNNNGGYVVIAYDSDKLLAETNDTMKELARNWRIGLSGQMIIAGNDGTIISNFDDSLDGLNLSSLGLELDGVQENTRIYGFINGVEYYYCYSVVDDYIIVVMQPLEEAVYAQTISTYLMIFVEVLVYAGIFCAVYFLVRNRIVDNVKKVNDDLAKITAGDLNTVVKVNNTLEFATLSNQINVTVDKLKELISDAKKRMEDELNYAAEIQRSSLPIDFPMRDDIDIYASMDPAKEVGGDFYDFYFINNEKLCILIADVSGKGVPASLFMMRAKTQIKAYAEYGFEVNDIFTDSNFNLVEGNDAGLFVTAWIGILDLKTGHLSYANAGHNPPLIKKPDGNYEFLKEKPGFVLGGMEGIAYKKFEMDLPIGSSIFIYTDGLTEAQNINKELYGDERLQNIINKCANLSSKEICEEVKKDILAFQGEANQFDDMTMLHLKYKNKLD